MIHISNSQADETILVIEALYRMSFGMNDTRSRNTKRRAKLIIEYLNKKRNGKKET